MTWGSKKWPNSNEIFCIILKNRNVITKRVFFRGILEITIFFSYDDLSKEGAIYGEDGQLVRSQRFLIEFILGPKHVRIPNFIKMSWKLQPVCSTQEYMDRQAQTDCESIGITSEEAISNPSGFFNRPHKLYHKCCRVQTPWLKYHHNQNINL